MHGNMKLKKRKKVVSWVTQVQGVRWRDWLNFVRWRQILEGLQYGICSMSGCSLRWLLNSVITCVPLPARTPCRHFGAAQQRSVSPKKPYKTSNSCDWKCGHCSSTGGKGKGKTYSALPWWTARILFLNVQVSGKGELLRDFLSRLHRSLCHMQTETDTVSETLWNF